MSNVTPASGSFYGEAQRALQDHFDTRTLADVHEAAIVTDTISDDQRAFIESRDFFFLSTVNADGWPTVSYKGGPIGVVRVEDDRTLIFPSYDGNGMFLSAGNIDARSRIGLLFIDLETPNRLRVHATASIHLDDPMLRLFPGAQLLVRARVDAAFPNCARYVHRHVRVASSSYVPTETGTQPYPAWKRIDLLQPFLSQAEQSRAEAAGGTITTADYNELLARGES
jgi:predicted pyridoxine 5'-phosphate oxidase superfamily flavin-nucleotide-binding protein